jgi:hypothetical protein
MLPGICPCFFFSFPLFLKSALASTTLFFTTLFPAADLQPAVYQITTLLIK